MLAAVLGLALCAPCAFAQSETSGVRKRADKAFEELDGRRPVAEKPSKKAAPPAKKPAVLPAAPAETPVVEPEPPAEAPVAEPEPPAKKPVAEPEPPADAPAPGVAVKLYWHMADDADVYLNGKPLRTYSPSFKTRGDEAPQPAFSTTAVLRPGDVFTVGGRRGGSYGFMLVATDFSGRVAFKTDDDNWRVYEPGDRPDWHQPETAAEAPKRPVVVQPDPWHPQKALNAWSGAAALSIWSEPKNTFAYLVGTAALSPNAGAPRPVMLQSINYPDHRVLHRGSLGLIAAPSAKEMRSATFKLSAGLADAWHVSLESADQPGHFLTRQDGLVLLKKDDGTQGFKTAATFKLAPGLADKSWASFEAFDAPGTYVRHKGFQLYAEGGSDDLFKKDATFQLVEPLSGE
ncbi:MAG: AbfB domain-containing protein [Elusimicrobiota bacterium]